MDLKSVALRLKRWIAGKTEDEPPDTANDWKIENERTIEKLRQQGVRIGDDCVIFTTQFSLEPYLVEIGNRVAISGGTIFLTHDGSIWLLRGRRANAQHFGKITVGDNTYIGQNCIVLPGRRSAPTALLGRAPSSARRFPTTPLSSAIRQRSSVGPVCSWRCWIIVPTRSTRCRCRRRSGDWWWNVTSGWFKRRIEE